MTQTFPPEKYLHSYSLPTYLSTSIREHPWGAILETSMLWKFIFVDSTLLNRVKILKELFLFKLFSVHIKGPNCWNNHFISKNLVCCQNYQNYWSAHVLQMRPCMKCESVSARDAGSSENGSIQTAERRAGWKYKAVGISVQRTNCPVLFRSARCYCWQVKTQCLPYFSKSTALKTQIDKIALKT